MRSRRDLGTIGLMGLAATSVVLTLGVLRNVWLTFAVYHLGFCILVPVLVRPGLARISWGRKAVAFGLGTGVVAFLGILLLYFCFGEGLLDPASLRSTLADWGGGNVFLLTSFMVLCNGIAEEFFWRGFIHDRLGAWRSRRGAVLTTTAFYASYHAFTALRLTGRPAVAVLMLAIVFSAGAFWGWTRERFGTPGPSMIGHALATAGYMLVYLLAVGEV
jgi:membrane protease YdiL (CAAX protease family)